MFRSPPPMFARFQLYDGEKKSGVYSVVDEDNRRGPERDMHDLFVFGCLLN